MTPTSRRFGCCALISRSAVAIDHTIRRGGDRSLPCHGRGRRVDSAATRTKGDGPSMPAISPIFLLLLWRRRLYGPRRLYAITN